MNELNHIHSVLKSRTKIRWLIRALKLSRFKDISGLLERIEKKIEQHEARKGESNLEEAALIVENILWAKLFRRLQAWKLKPFQVVTLNGYDSSEGQEKDGPKDPPLESASPFNGNISRCQIYKERHYRFKNNPAILLPGFVPEGNEAYYLLRHSFLKYGSTYYINFPRDHYDSEQVYQQLFELISQINQRRIQTAGRKQIPLLVGTSFGCAVIRNFIAWLNEKGLQDKVDIAGLVFLSPVLCMEDVCLPGETRQPTLVARAIAPLFELKETEDDAVTKAMIRAKGIFLKMFKAGQKQLDPSIKARIPVLAIEEEVIDFFNIADHQLAGYFKRYVSLRSSTTPDTSLLSNLPALTLMAEGERDVLIPGSPTLKVFEDADQFKNVFPNGTLLQVASDDPTRKVTHSDLIFNADCYRKHLDPWLAETLRRP